MIDWIMVGSNTLWILGLAIALAALSYASWQSWATHEPFRQTLSRPSFQAVLNLAGLLFCLGLAATSSVLWQAVIWLLLAALFLWRTWTSLRKMN